MKTKLFFIALLVNVLFMFSSVNAQTVYVTESGKKYHAKNCNIVKTGKKGMELSEAKKKGYTPCASCKAEAVVATDKKKETKATDTKNAK
jgi:hypothetical protein